MIKAGTVKLYAEQLRQPNMPSGSAIDIVTCLSVSELKRGEEIESGVYSIRMGIAEITEDGDICTELPR